MYVDLLEAYTQLFVKHWWNFYVSLVNFESDMIPFNANAIDIIVKHLGKRTK